MRPSAVSLGLLAVVLHAPGALTQGASTLRPDPPKLCDGCDEWNRDQFGRRVFGNTYNVGPAGLSAVLITSPGGHILLDGALPQSAAIIDRNIRALGFRTDDIRYILSSHGHYDHAGGIAALQRASNARSRRARRPRGRSRRARTPRTTRNTASAGRPTRSRASPGSRP